MGRKRERKAPKHDRTAADTAHTTGEMPVCGWHACLALYQYRRQDIRRILVEPGKAKRIAEILSWAARCRLPYRTEHAGALSRAAGTAHHEGIVFIAREKQVPPFEQFTAEPGEETILLVLENVQNPHNVGAILRSAAFFGVQAVILGGHDAPRRLSPAVLRTSQGGAECVPVYRTEAPPRALEALSGRGVTVVGTDVFGKDLFRSPEVLPPAGPVCFVLGSEGAGMSAAVRDRCDVLVQVPGTGAVESLNVSAACALFLGLFKERCSRRPRSE